MNKKTKEVDRIQTEHWKKTKKINFFFYVNKI